ncbi:MAG: TolC family protein [Polyangiales bacterium]
MDLLERFRTPRSTIVDRRCASYVLMGTLFVSSAAFADDREAPPPHVRGSADDASATSPTPDFVPDPTAGNQVSLAGILAFADEHSPVLAVARSTRSRAEAERVAASILLPTNPDVYVAAGPRFGISGTGVDVDVSVLQQIQIGGVRRRRIDAADRFADLTDAEIERMRWAVHTDVHAAFHRALVDQERVRLAARVVTFQQEVLHFAERVAAAGETAPLTLRLARAEVAQSEQVLIAAEQTFLASRIRLAQLSGWPVTNPPTPGGNVDEPRDPQPFEQLMAIAGERLPAVIAAVARVREAEARVALADREGLPRPSVGFQFRREGNPTSEGPYNIYLGLVSVPIPLFQRNQGDRARARAELEVAEAELGSIRQLLGAQIAEARSEMVAAAARTRTYGTEILPRFEENLTLLRRSFELGEIDILALSTGRERFLRIQSDALGAQQDYFVALAGLQRVVGVDLFHDVHDVETTP